jgi:hypothetical protein
MGLGTGRSGHPCQPMVFGHLDERNQFVQDSVDEGHNFVNDRCVNCGWTTAEVHARVH